MSNRVDTFVEVMWQDFEDKPDHDLALPELLDMEQDEVQELLTRLIHPDLIMENPGIQTIEQVLALCFTLGVTSGIQAERHRSLAAMWEEA